LGPRRQLTATPNALFALNTGTFNGQAPAFYQNAANLNAGLLGSARLSGGYTNVLSLTNIGNTFAGTFAGSGSSLTGLNASSLTLGTVPDARLSSNVALLDTAQIFTASKTFTGTGGSTLSISRATPGGLALNIVNGGGSSIFVNNNAAGLIGYGLNLSVDGTSTKYGVLMDITGASGPGYGIYQSNSTINGRGLQADMSGTGTTYGVRITNNSPTGYGGYFNNTSLTGITYGLYCENNSADGYGIFALHDSSTGTGPAIYGRSDSTSSFAFAIHGLINSTTPGGSSAAVRGENNGAAGSGIGVWGSQDGGGYGVYGTAVNGYGVYGRSSGTGRGVYGYSTGGYGGYFDTGVAGGVALYVNGTASVGVITIRGGADLAEDFAVAGPAEALEPGMVVMIDAEHVGGIKLADGAYNKHVAGVLSGANGLSAAMTMGKFEGQVNAKPVALSGRVWTYVDASTAAVEPGDLLTTSLTPGHAMVASDSSRSHGATIGKAMSRMPKGEKGLVLVLVNLQ